MINIFTLIDNEVRNMQLGQVKHYGSGIALEDMLGVYRFLCELESEGLLSILNVHTESMTGHDLVDMVQVERI